MVSNEIVASIGLDATDVYAEVDAMKSATDALMADWAVKRNIMITQANSMLSMTAQVTRIFKNVVTAMGGTINPITESILGMVQTMALSIAGAGRLYQVVGGPAGLILGTIMVTLAAVFQIENQIAVQKGMDEVASQFSAARGAMLQVESLSSQLARLF